MNEQILQMPSTDILECEDGFHIYMDIPGVSADELSIDLEENELAIRGKSRYDAIAGHHIRNEFGAQNYERVFTLSEIVDKDNIRATVKDGVLDLFLPRAESMKPRRIEVNAPPAEAGGFK
jgi:HSP20 family molecular chaperone IbpA